MRTLLHWLVLSFAVWLTAAILPGFHVNGFGGALRVAALFGVLNWLFGWFIFAVLGIATLGIGFILAFLTRWLVMAILLSFVDGLSSSFHIDGFGTAVLGALLMSGIAALTELGIRGFARKRAS
jgi:putative membrane protein